MVEALDVVGAGVTKKKPREVQHLCKHCGKSFRRTGHRNRHELTHTDEKPYKCLKPGCGRSFRRMEALRRHNETVHTPAELKEMFKCPHLGCGEEFDLMNGLRVHLRLHEENAKIGKYSCDICIASFTKKWKLNRHKSDMHGHLKPFACTHEGCNERFLREVQLVGHVKRRHAVHFCFEPECQHLDAFTTRNALFKHNKEFHPLSPDLLKCTKCGRQCYSESGLTHHMNWHEKREVLEKELFSCDFPFCTKFFSSHTELIAHVQEKHINARHRALRICLPASKEGSQALRIIVPAPEEVKEN